VTDSKGLEFEENCLFSSEEAAQDFIDEVLKRDDNYYFENREYIIKELQLDAKVGHKIRKFWISRVFSLDGLGGAKVEPIEGLSLHYYELTDYYGKNKWLDDPSKKILKIQVDLGGSPKSYINDSICFINVLSYVSQAHATYICEELIPIYKELKAKGWDIYAIKKALEEYRP
jgi:hypothetical protein